MMVFFNRMRGGGVKYGSIYASLAIGLFFGILTLDPYIGLACASGYLIGESICGWGAPIGTCTEGRQTTSHDINVFEDGSHVGVRFLTMMVLHPKEYKKIFANARITIINLVLSWLRQLSKLLSKIKLGFSVRDDVQPIKIEMGSLLTYSRVFLIIRGIYWAIPTLAPLFFTSINPLVVIGCIVWLGVSFPLACELAYRTYPKLQSDFLGFNTAWNTQEGFYGLAWDIALIILGFSQCC